MDIEIVRLEPPNTKICPLYSGRKIPAIELGDDSIGGIRWAILNVFEPSAPVKTPANPF
jgi:hypothetical protein